MIKLKRWRQVTSSWRTIWLRQALHVKYLSIKPASFLHSCICSAGPCFFLCFYRSSPLGSVGCFDRHCSYVIFHTFSNKSHDLCLLVMLPYFISNMFDLTGCFVSLIGETIYLNRCPVFLRILITCIVTAQVSAST